MKKSTLCLASLVVMLAGCKMTSVTTKHETKESGYCNSDQSSCVRQCRDEYKNPDSLLQNCLQQCQINSPQCETDSQPGSWEVKTGW